MNKIPTLLLFLLLLNTACNSDSPAPADTAPKPAPTLGAGEGRDTMAAGSENQAPEPLEEETAPPAGAVDNTQAKSATPAPARPPAPVRETPVAKSGFDDVAALDRSIVLDIRYATTNNFTKAKIYDCPRCLLRPAAAKALIKAHKALQQKGYGLKMFDCYRPRPFQQRLWDKVPNPDYVTPPAKGSMHSRGAAVDLTIVDRNGKELDMGTPYDFFGREAHTDNRDLPARVLANRRLLTETMEEAGFKGIRTEWWHFSFQGKNHALSDYVWPCE